MKTVVILLLFTQLAVAQNISYLDVLSHKDKELLNNLLLETEGSSWFFDDTRIKKYNPKILQLYTLDELLEHEKEPKVKCLIALYIGALYYKQDIKINTAKQFLTKAYLAKESVNNERITAFLCAALGDLEKMTGNYIYSIYYFNKGLENGLKRGDYTEQYRNLREIGVNYREIGNYSLAEEYLFRAEDLIKNVKITLQDKVWINIHIGRLFRLKKDYTLARKHYQKALKLNNYKADPRLETYALHEYMLYWNDLKNIDSTTFYAKKILDITNGGTHSATSKNVTLNRYVLPLSYKFLADYNLNINEVSTGIAYYKKAFNVGKSMNLIIDTRIIAKEIIKKPVLGEELRLAALNYLDASFKDQQKPLENSKKIAEEYRKVMEKDFQLELKKIEASSSKFLDNSLWALIFIFLLFLIVFYVQNKNYSHLSNKKTAAIKRLKQSNKQVERSKDKIENIMLVTRIVSNSLTEVLTRNAVFLNTQKRAILDLKRQLKIYKLQCVKSIHYLKKIG